MDDDELSDIPIEYPCRHIDLPFPLISSSIIKNKRICAIKSEMNYLNMKQPKLVLGESKCPEGTFFCDGESFEMISAAICVYDDLKAKAEKHP